MHLKLILLTTASLALMTMGCDNASSDSEPVSRPAATAATPNEIPVNAKPGQTGGVDPARTTAAPPAMARTSMAFASYEHDFGTLDEGDVSTYMFEFTNSGTEPLIIDNCKGSCGCTVPQCPKQPIPPGEKGEIEVKFNSKGKKNQQTKKVTINANTDPAQTFLTITAFVTPAIEG